MGDFYRFLFTLLVTKNMGDFIYDDDDGGGDGGRRRK